MGEPAQRRYLDEATAADYVGISARALRSLPIPVCKPNRRKLYDVKDLDSYMKGVKCLPSIAAANRTGHTRKRSRQTSGLGAPSFREVLARQSAGMPKSEPQNLRRRSEKNSPSDTSL